MIFIFIFFLLFFCNCPVDSSKYYTHQRHKYVQFLCTNLISANCLFVYCLLHYIVWTTPQFCYLFTYLLSIKILYYFTSFSFSSRGVRLDGMQSYDSKYIQEKGCGSNRVMDTFGVVAPLDPTNTSKHINYLIMNKRISKIVSTIKYMSDLVEIFHNEITQLNNHYQLTF